MRTQKGRPAGRTRRADHRRHAVWLRQRQSIRRKRDGAHRHQPQPQPQPLGDAASVSANIQSAWVVLGEDNRAIARAITSYSAPLPASGSADLTPPARC